LRLDAHQSFTPEHIPEHLGPILKRNKFEGSIAVARDAAETRQFLEFAARHEFIRGVVGCGGEGHPKFVGDSRFEVEDAAEALRLAQDNTERKIAIVRLGSPPVGREGADAWAESIARAAANPRVFCKASGLLSLVPRPWKAEPLRPFVQHVLRAFGPSRVMFGSDWPSCLPDAIWKETLAMFTQAIGPQTMDVREELLGGAAARFYSVTPAVLPPAC
jgi:L-fuconolactonase